MKAPPNFLALIEDSVGLSYFLRKAQKCVFAIKAPFCEENKGESEGVRVSSGDLKMQRILKH